MPWACDPISLWRRDRTRLGRVQRAFCHSIRVDVRVKPTVRSAGGRAFIDKMRLELENRGGRGDADVGVGIGQKLAQNALRIAPADGPEGQRGQDALAWVLAGHALLGDAVALVAAEHADRPSRHIETAVCWRTAG